MDGISQRGVWWCPLHAQVVAEKVTRGPLANKSKVQWDTLMRVAHAQLNLRMDARVAGHEHRQRIRDLELREANEANEVE